jgi:Ser/Thr protein kinase RdoA (MazF antagonist)
MNLDQALQIVQNQYGITGTIKLLYGEVDYNFLLTTDDKQYTLKISRAHPDKDLLDLQNQALIHLEQKNTSLEYPYVIKNKDGQYLGWHGDHAVRLLKWIPGRLWSQLSTHTPELLHDLGTVCGQTALALQDFDHPHAHRFFKWDNQRFEWIEEHLEKLQTKDQKELFQHFLSLIKKDALPHFAS